MVVDRKLSSVNNYYVTGVISVSKLAVKYSFSGVNEIGDSIILSYEGTKHSQKFEGADEEVVLSESKRTKAIGKNSKDKVCLDQTSDGHNDHSKFFVLTFWYQFWHSWQMRNSVTYS